MGHTQTILHLTPHLLLNRIGCQEQISAPGNESGRREELMDDFNTELTLSQLNDDELVKRAQVRTEEGRLPAEAWEAWVVLYQKHQKSLLNTILGFLGSPQLYSVAVDLVDSTFTKALEALPKKNQGSPFAPWLRAIARNETWKWFQHQRVTSLQGYMEQVEDPEQAEEPGWVFLTGGHLAQPTDIELRESIERAKMILSDREYQVFVLHYEEGLEVEEIASELNMRPASVRQMLWRATTRFKSDYEGPRPATRKKRPKNKQPQGEDVLPS